MDRYAHLPDDIALEKRLGEELRQRYKGSFLGGLRRFRALRRQAPGVIAEFVLAALVFGIAASLLFRDLNVVGLLPVAGFSLYFIFVVFVSFWLAGRIWRLTGLSVRNGARFVVTNMWMLAVTAILIASAVAHLLSL